MSKQEYKGYRRNYLLVINLAVMDHYEEIRDYLIKELGANYFVSSIEENEQENLHMHVFVQFPKCTRISYQKCFGAHVEECKKSERANINYTTKYKYYYGIDNTVDEYGTCRFGIGKNQHSLTALELKETPLTEVPWFQFKTWSALQQCQNLKEVDDDDGTYKKDIEVYYIYGPSGSGKTRFVRNWLRESKMEFNKVKHVNGFWLGVNPLNMPEVAWYDEFRPSHLTADEFIQFIDYSANEMHVKYFSNVLNKYKTIFITSIVDPEDLYINSPEKRDQWTRRIKHFINMEEYNKLNEKI